MPLPIVEDTFLCRFVWESSTGPRPASHGIHVRDETGLLESDQVAALISGNLSANMWRLVASVASIRRIIVWKLDGQTAPAEASFVIGSATHAGSGAGDPIPQGAAVVTITSALRGPAWRNRSYLPFVGETEQASGTLSTTSVATAQTAWNTFMAACESDGIPLTVVSPSQATPGARWADATAAVVRGNLKTQRRRARR